VREVILFSKLCQGPVLEHYQKSSAAVNSACVYEISWKVKSVIESKLQGLLLKGVLLSCGIVCPHSWNLLTVALWDVSTPRPCSSHHNVFGSLRDTVIGHILANGSEVKESVCAWLASQQKKQTREKPFVQPLVHCWNKCIWKAARSRRVRLSIQRTRYGYMEYIRGAQIRAPCCPCHWIAYGGISYMLVLSMEWASCHSSIALKFEEDSKFCKKLCNLILSLERWMSSSSILTAWTRRMALSGAHHGKLLVIPCRNGGNFPLRIHLSLLALLWANRATTIHII
jgi:hypothetical protein